MLDPRAQREVPLDRYVFASVLSCDPPASGKRTFGYSHDKRSDCVQVVIALIVTQDGAVEPTGTYSRHAPETRARARPRS